MKTTLILLLCCCAAAAQPQLQQIQLGSYTYECYVQGNPQGEPVILLHGWPETASMWLPIMDSLAGQGYFCIAPHQRGFSPRARPMKRKHYRLDSLSRDILRLADHFELDKFQLIGHDWGSAIGWCLASWHPDRVHSYVAMSVPHIKAFGDAIQHDKDQHKRSYYMRLFQWPGLPETILKAKNCKKLREEIWIESDSSELAGYMDRLCDRKALRATLNYYRANYKLIRKFDDEDFPKIEANVLMIYGNQDEAVGRVAVENTPQYVTGDYKLVELDASHWLVQEEFSMVCQTILKHLANNKMK